MDEKCGNSIACLVKPRSSRQKSPNSFPVLYLRRMYVHSRMANFILFACRSLSVRLMFASPATTVPCMYVQLYLPGAPS